MLNNHSTKQKTNFFNKYSYFIVVTVGVLTLSLLLIITSLYSPQEPAKTVNAPILFAMPVMDATIHKNYNGQELQYNATLNMWEAHKAVDFLVSSNLNVCAAYDGVVNEIYTNYLEGTVIVIDHGKGLKTSYGSLDKDSLVVEVGATVQKGQKIAVASNSANRETNLGAYLHFITYDNGKKIDPSGYLNMELK